jgi:hypothetical protein
MTLIHCDNQSYIKLLENLVFHDRYKNVEIKYHFIRDMVQKGSVKLQYISIYEKIADIFTKPLSKKKIIYFKYKICMMKNVSLNERDC